MSTLLEPVVRFLPAPLPRAVLRSPVVLEYQRAGAGGDVPVAGRVEEHRLVAGGEVGVARSCWRAARARRRRSCRRRPCWIPLRSSVAGAAATRASADGDVADTPVRRSVVGDHADAHASAGDIALADGRSDPVEQASAAGGGVVVGVEVDAAGVGLAGRGSNAADRERDEACQRARIRVRPRASAGQGLRRCVGFIVAASFLIRRGRARCSPPPGRSVGWFRPVCPA